MFSYDYYSSEEWYTVYQESSETELSRIVLKRSKNATESQLVHKIVEVTRSSRISFPYFELLYEIVTFPYNFLLLTLSNTTECSTVHARLPRKFIHKNYNMKCGKIIDNV